MKDRGVVFASLVLVVSVLLLVDKLFVSESVRIVLENGVAVPVRGSNFYDLSDVLFLIVLSWLGGMSFVYIFVKTGSEAPRQGALELPDVKAPLQQLQVSDPRSQQNRKPASTSIVSAPTPEDSSLTGLDADEKLLEILDGVSDGDEKTLFKRVLEQDGILQRELVKQTGFSESKVSRLLDRLERRGLVVRRRFGMGNKILLNRK